MPRYGQVLPSFHSTFDQLTSSSSVWRSRPPDQVFHIFPLVDKYRDPIFSISKSMDMMYTNCIQIPIAFPNKDIIGSILCGSQPDQYSKPKQQELWWMFISPISIIPCLLMPLSILSDLVEGNTYGWNPDIWGKNQPASGSDVPQNQPIDRNRPPKIPK